MGMKGEGIGRRIGKGRGGGRERESENEGLEEWRNLLHEAEEIEAHVASCPGDATICKWEYKTFLLLVPSMYL